MSALVADMVAFVVYRMPATAPAPFAVRAFNCLPGKLEPLRIETPHGVGDIYCCQSLADARRVIPAGLVRFDPSADDPPQIVECWL
jgi:hypothetical protein